MRGPGPAMTNILDFLMTLTETKNSVLSKATSFDPSYISRIRSGSRGIPQSLQFLDSAAAYFARNIRTDYQMQLLMEELAPGLRFPEDRDALQELIKTCLSQGKAMPADTIGGFLTGFSAATKKLADYSFNGQGISGSSTDPEQLAESIAQNTMSLTAEPGKAYYFYGTEGKRNAVEYFLGNLCSSGKAYRLMLFSDEEMSWLVDDPAFTGRWSTLLMQLLTTGSRISIPHNVTRDSNEMLESVEKWIPLYMTGAIEPYYYPRLRDGVYHRSLFIAEGDSAVISCSVGANTEGMLNILIRDRRAVRALEQEYAAYLALCKPLMHIHNHNDGRQLLNSLNRFEKLPGDMIIAHPVPSFFTMPQSVVDALQLRSQDSRVSERYQRSYATFRSHLRKGDSVTEILHLPAPETVLSEGCPLPFSDLTDSGLQDGIRLSASELKSHLKNVIRLLRREPGYHVILSDSVPAGITLAAKEDSAAILSTSYAPSFCFEIEERNMIAAFREYLLHIYESCGNTGAEETAARLEQYCDLLG